MRERIREWRRNRQRPPGLNTVADAERFAEALREVRHAPAVDDTQEIPVVAPQSAPDSAPVARALCSQCRRPVKLRKDGVVAAHRGCDGGGREPLALAECTVCSPADLPVFAEAWHGLGHPVLAWDGDAA